MTSKQEYKYIGECKGNNDNGCFMESPGHNCGCFKKVQEEPKQLTDREEYQSVKDFSRGAKWQARRMYSEGEVETIAKDAYNMGKNNILIGVFNKWFQQYKKK
jgi:hypothetical protein